MPSLKDLRNRIGSVQSTQKITRAMQMVAASKLRRAQDSAEQARPYAEQISAMLSRLGRAQLVADDPRLRLLAGTGADKTHLLIIATAMRGLCGGFNGSIVRLARQKLDELQKQGKEVKILCVGSKGYDVLKRQYASILLDPISLPTRAPDFATAEEIASQVLDLFDKSAFDVAHIFYAAFQSVMTQTPSQQQLIPLAIDDTAQEGSAHYEYEPDEETILSDILPHNIAVQILHALLENAASEQGARMSAMDNATRNAGDMIDRLTIVYNRSRQAMITKELIEIISGAEAL